MKTPRQRCVQVTGELLKVVEVEAATDTRDGFGPLSFRVELIRVPGRSKAITARIWRKEFYRIKPAFPQKHGKPSLPGADEVLLIEETSLLGEGVSFEGKSLEVVLDHVLRSLNKRLFGST